MTYNYPELNLRINIVSILETRDGEKTREEVAVSFEPIVQEAERPQRPGGHRIFSGFDSEETSNRSFTLTINQAEGLLRALKANLE